MPPTLSVVIPTRDRPQLLADCLVTLARQDIPPGLVEVVVVDDGSDPPLRGVVDAASAGSAHVTVRGVDQPPGGLNAGRNRGVAESRAGLVAFLDDDTLVDPGWAAAMIAAFEQGADAVAGRIRLRLEGPAPPWLGPGLRTYLSELELGDRPRRLDPPASPFGANCAVRRDAVERAGGFRVGLDRVGASLVSNGDTEFFSRVRAGGGRILYWPAAVVDHRVPPERLTAAWFRRRARAQGVSDVAVAGSTRARLPSLAREALRAGRAGPIALRGVASGRGLEPAAIWLAYCSGRAAAIRSPDSPTAR